MIGVVTLLVTTLLPLSSETTCGNLSGCIGCGGSVISCQGVGLTEFPEFSVAHAAAVEDLILSGNYITAISAVDLQHFTSLVELDISSNDITYIEEGSFVANTNLSIIELSSNELICDCQLRWLVDYLDSLSQVDDWTCEFSNGSIITRPTKAQLICECAMGCGSTGVCDLSTGLCECNPGYIGDNCSEVCSQGMYGLNCDRVCSCEAGSCHHITGECSCYPEHYGVNCSHNCRGAPDCDALGREACSLSTPEHSCGACQVHSAAGGQPGSGWGNSSCGSESSQSYTHSSLTVDPTTIYPTKIIYTTINPTTINSTPASSTTLLHTHVLKSSSSSNNLTKAQLVLAIACPLIILLLVVDIVILLCIVGCIRYTFKRSNRINPLLRAEL